MPAETPSIDELRRRAAEQGVSPTDEDLELVEAFLRVLEPALAELERLVPPSAAPSGVFRPEEEP
jgi:hypothetical protein